MAQVKIRKTKQSNRGLQAKFEVNAQFNLIRQKMIDIWS